MWVQCLWMPAEGIGSPGAVGSGDLSPTWRLTTEKGTEKVDLMWPKANA